MNKNLFQFHIFLFWITISSSLPAQTLHAILFADTDDSKIGTSCQSDYIKMGLEMSTLAAATQMNLKEYYYKGSNFNKEKVMNVINSLNISAKDIIFFCYSGHGARSVNDNSNFPQLALGNTDADFVALTQIDRLLQAKNPRLRIVLADCCNSISYSLSPKKATGNETIIRGVVEQNYQKLFLQQKGGIMVCSSEPGIPSPAEPGGGALITTYIVELQKLVNGLNGDISWSNLFSTIRGKVKNEYDVTPQFTVNVEPYTSSTPTIATAIISPTTVTPITVSTQDTQHPLTKLMEIIDLKKKEDSRISMINTLLNTCFSSPTTKVEVIAQNGETLLKRYTASDYLKYLAISKRIIRLSDAGSDISNHKFNTLRVHEIHY